MLSLLLVASAAAGPRVEAGGSVRAGTPHLVYESLDGGQTPAIGLDAGLVTGDAPVALRLGGSIEGWHARWTWNDEVYEGGFDARAEARLALRLATGSRDLFGTVDLGPGVAAVTGSRWPVSPTISLRPALHGTLGRTPVWAAVDLRAGLARPLALVYCISVPCPSVRGDPGGTGVALVVGTDLGAR